MYLDTYPVEQGVPIPTPTIGNGKYDWGRLSVSESIFVPLIYGKRSNFRDCIRNCAKSYGKRHGKLFRFKMAATGIRVWRIL